MAFSVGTMWDVRSGGGDGNAGAGGGFATDATFATDLAATSATGTAPVVTSASYNFITRDSSGNHWLFIKTGGTYKPGWYPIVSTSANAATINAAAGAWVDYTTYRPGTTNGCATTASPTGGTWSIDYSQSTSIGITYTDMVIDGTTNTKYTSAAFPVGPHVVGNTIAVSTGTGFTVQRVQIVSVSGTTATCDKSLGTLSSTGGNGKLGGALASPGQASGLMVGGNTLWQKSATYTVSSASTNVANGCVSIPAAASASQASRMIGWNAVRGDGGISPLLKASLAITSFTLVASGTNCWVENVEVDGSAQTSSRGFNTPSVAGTATLYRCLSRNCTNGGLSSASGQLHAILCGATGCSSVTAIGATSYLFCVAYNNTIAGLGGGTLFGCVSCNNTGATVDGFIVGGTQARWVNCLAYGNGRHGFYNNTTATNIRQEAINCLAVNNGGYGFTAVSAVDYLYLYNCSGFNNTSGLINNVIIGLMNQLGLITLSADPFVNAAGNNFALNNTAGGGALLRAAGIPGALAANQLPGLSTLNFLDVGAVQHRHDTIGWAGMGV
jgi:hypothetical protein